MNNENDKPSFWSRSPVRWTATVLLGLVFVLAFIVFLAADLVSRDLLDADLYTNALEEEDIYNRVYTELLADPALVKATGLMLGNVNLDPSLAHRVLNFTTSTLYLVMPPETIQSAVEGAINSATAYFRGETEAGYKLYNQSQTDGTPLFLGRQSVDDRGHIQGVIYVQQRNRQAQPEQG